METPKHNLHNKYYKQCGEVFLTLKGNIVFHCTLCENKYVGFREYARHVVKEHYESEITETETIIAADEGNSSSDVADVPETHADDNKETKEKSNSLLLLENEDTNQQTKLNSIEEHEPENQRPHTCQQCGLSFKHISNLLSHIKRHSNRKPHKCTHCPKSFYTRSELKKHTRRHTGERPFLCSDCGRKFISSSALTSHAQRHTNDRKKHCPICEMKFFNNCMLKEHMAVHTNDRPHKCKTCNAGFKLLKTLRNHEKIHENKRGYQCQLCSARFNQKPGLHSHMKSKHTLVYSTSSPTNLND